MEEFELEPGEKIILRVRRHIFVLIIEMIPFAFFALIPLFFPLLVTLMTGMNAAGGVVLGAYITGANPWIRFGLGAWWLFIWLAAFSTLTKYMLTVWVITTTRIVDIHQYGFWDRKVSSFLLARVQDVTTDVQGFFSTLIGFGTLNVETAGRDEKFSMTEIKGPERLRDLIMREIAAIHAGAAAAPANPPTDTTGV